MLDMYNLIKGLIKAYILYIVFYPIMIMTVKNISSWPNLAVIFEIQLSFRAQTFEKLILFVL